MGIFVVVFMAQQIASPACTELEVAMLDWLGKMLQLPAEFLASSGGKGGGVIQGTASEATLVALLGAKAKVLQKVKAEHPDWDDAVIIPKLVGYCSSECFANFCQKKVANFLFSCQKFIIVKKNSNFSPNNGRISSIVQAKRIRRSSGPVCWAA